jgi:hypothetical protein
MSPSLDRACAAAALALAILAGCATSGSQSGPPATTQPALTQAAMPYVDGLRSAGIYTVQTYGNRARVRLSTVWGEVYFRYPDGVPATSFILYNEPTTGMEVDSDNYSAANAAQYVAAIQAIVPLAIEKANANNSLRRGSALGR